MVIRERHEARVDVVGIAKDGTTESQTLSQWDSRGDWWSRSNENDQNDASPDPESSDESDQPEANSPSPESGSHHNSPSRPSGSTSSTDLSSWPLLEMTHAYFPLGGDGMASHDSIADGDQLLLLPSWLSTSPPQTPTDVSSSPASSGHAIPQWLFDDPPPRTQTPSTPPALSPTDSEDKSYSSNSNYYSTNSGSTGSGPADSGLSYTSRPQDPSPSNSEGGMPTASDASASLLSTGRYPPQSPGQTDNHPPPSPPPNPPPNPAPSTGPQQSTDGFTSASPKLQNPAEPESGTFLRELLNGKIKRHSSGTL